MTVDIAFSREGNLGLVNLNRPQALNALSLAMIKALQQQLLQWEDDHSIHAVVVQAEGEKAFCAGGDVRWLYDEGLAKSPEQMQFFWHEYRLNHYIHQFKKPYIPLMDGITMGGGVGISLHGSHPVATERFVFAMPETGIGFFPDIGASYLLSRCPGQIGIYLGLTGNRLRTADAQALGLVVKYTIASEDLSKVITSLLASDLSNNAHQAVNDCLLAFARPVESAPIENLRSAIDDCFAENSVEAIFAKLGARGDDWSLATLANLQQKAPLSLKVTLAQIHKAKSLTLAECLKMDYRLVNQFMRDSDFYEGIRALLVDKDKSPHWQPATLALATETKVVDYFEDGHSELSFY
ncbi:putative enoyl-CoA hydratase echA8 [Legionella massiliensis]|uniref:3-hydroxyisobutyryl-CoA hydrolase n=1 Tax=Legionella massiliensis TaxID=1034943 RepID=A0A078L138_9GAMM|nr:enoyl-CoA hydratase/isomerase family protein [Legionella massiliensis]CDZ78927.1 putative enoyl-CoA hydratase echA8 [Legionella massiliensis]CEE14665.1 putative enoyl-CoA hydratase echA8 [Legionella massiliensis]